MLPRRYHLRIVCGAAVCALGLAAAGQQQAHHAPAKSAAKKPAQTKPATKAPAQQATTFTDAIRENNVGIALMELHKFSEALSHFQRACVLNPQSDAGCLNMGIALLNMGRYDDAESILEKSAEHQPQNARPWFNLGLLNRQSNKPDFARQDFQKAAALDPNDPDIQYFLGYLAEEDRQFGDAAKAFQKAIELDPSHASANYGLSQADQNLGDADGAKAHLAVFQHVTSERISQPIRFIYGEQGKYSLAQEMEVPPQSAGPAIPVHFVDVSSLSGLPTKIRANAEIAGTKNTPGVLSKTPAPPTLAQFLGSGACVFDYDGDGKPDIFLVNADGKGNAALYKNLGKGKFTDVTKAAALAFSGDGTGCAVGDYDNDGHPDLAVSSAHGVVLFHNKGDGTFEDVTDAAGVRIDGFVLGLTFIDYDGDGDLDLYATRFSDFPLRHPGQPFSFPEDAQPPGNILWRNQGNGKFMDITKEMGLSGDAPSIGALAVDLNNDRAIDLVLTGWEKYPSVLLNPRDGAFHTVSPWAIAMPGPAAGAAALDFDGDGWMDLAFTHWAPPGLSLWHNIQGKSFERVALVGPGWMRGWGLATLDYDNDGWTDIVAVGETFSGEGRIALYRNEGAAGFRDVTHEVGLDKIVLRNPRGVIAFDYDGDGSTDLLITQNSGPPVLLKNEGGEKNDWLQLSLAGDTDNRMAIQSRVTILSGAQRQTIDVPAASGYLGQGPSEVLTGVGDVGIADVVRILWPSGAVQNQLQTPGDMRTLITEGTNP